MSRIRSFTVCLFALASVSAATVSAQGKPQIQVLQLQMPSGVLNLPAQHAEGILSVRFDGRITPGRNLYVRVFRDKLSDLINAASQTPGNKCVVYAHASRFRVTLGNDQQLRINDLLGFYINATNTPNQTMTLVFEEGDDPDSNGTLHLEKKDVSEYFANAVVMPLLVTEAIQAQWTALNRQTEQASRSQVATQTGWHSWFKAKPAEAAETVVVPAAQAATPLPDKLFVPPCQVVTPIRYVPLQSVASLDPSAQEALRPVATRQSQPCG